MPLDPLSSEKNEIWPLILEDLISQNMFGYRENERKWRKVENYIERNLESSKIRKYQKSLNESISFLFIGQGQVDTWHHLRGLSEASSSRNLKKIHFRTSPSNFARWCKVEDPSALFSSSLSVLHDCAKISHGHAKLLFTFPLVCCNQNPSFSFRMTMRKFHMVMRNWKTCFFDSSLQFLSFLHF